METKNLRDFAKDELDYELAEGNLRKKIKKGASKVGKAVKWLVSEGIEINVHEGIGDLVSFTMDSPEYQGSPETIEVMKFLGQPDLSTVIGFNSRHNQHRYTQMMKLIMSPQWQKQRKSEVYPENVQFGHLSCPRTGSRVPMMVGYFCDGNTTPILTWITTAKYADKVREILNTSLYV